MQSSILTRSRVVVSFRPSRRTCVAPRANLVDDLGQGFAKIFSPPSSTLKDVQRSEGSFKGDKSRKKSGPFKDGFVGSSAKKAQPVKSKAAAVTSKPVKGKAAADEEEESGNFLDYIGSGLKSLVSKNFSRSSEEPEWMNKEPTGYKGPNKRGKSGGMYGRR